MNKPPVICNDTTCPRCGNRDGNLDHGSYEPDPLDAGLGGTPDPCVHLIECGNCRKPFDVAPEWYIRSADGFKSLKADLACQDCASEVRVTVGSDRYRPYRARVIHSDGCPWYAKHLAKVPGYYGAVPCSTVVTHRGPYKRDPARGGAA